MSHETEPELPPELERYTVLCIRMYERMKAEDSFPWSKELHTGEAQSSKSTKGSQ